MKAWMSGNVAGTGTFRCTECDFPVSLDAADELPSCPNCGGTEFVRASLFTTSQQAYAAAVADLFTTLDDLEERLAGRRHLFGGQITAADVRLWVTLARFDAVYVTHFKANLRRLVDYPNLWGYARDLYQQPAFGQTTNFDHIKRHYYGTHPQINPLRIVPAGPILDWAAPHHRESMPS